MSGKEDGDLVTLSSSTDANVTATMGEEEEGDGDALPAIGDGGGSSRAETLHETSEPTHAARWNVSAGIVDRFPGNLGHRGGRDYAAALPENSLQALRATAPFQAAWRYLEFDVRETQDHQLVLFHDKTLGRLLPEGRANSAAAGHLSAAHGKPYQKITVAELTLAELQTLGLNGVSGWRVPTLDEFLAECRRLQVTAPVVVEVKDLRTPGAREAFLSKVSEFKAWHAQAARPRTEGDGWDFMDRNDTGDRLVLLGYVLENLNKNHTFILSSVMIYTIH